MSVFVGNYPFQSHFLFRALSGVSLLLMVGCSGGEPAPVYDPITGLPVATGGTTNAPDTSSGVTPPPTSSGAVSQPTSGAPVTELVCTPGCTDVPRASESCADAKSWGFCGTDWFGDNCKKTCGTCTGSEQEVCVEQVVSSPGTGGSSGGGSSSGTTPVTPVPAGAQQGWASRYWDCCKQHCSWKENSDKPAVSCNAQDVVLSDPSAASACGGGGAYTCSSMAPWAVSDNLAYGFAATPPGSSCGKCYQLDFTGQGQHDANDPGSKKLVGKTMIVQATNIGHDVNGGQFDILIPGGGVGAFNACATEWGVSDLGAQYGGFLTTCNGDVNCLRNKCNATFKGKPDLLEGCLFHADWMAGANNPKFRYAEVACPAALNQASGM